MVDFKQAELATLKSNCTNITKSAVKTTDQNISVSSCNLNDLFVFNVDFSGKITQIDFSFIVRIHNGWTRYKERGWR